MGMNRHGFLRAGAGFLEVIMGLSGATPCGSPHPDRCLRVPIKGCLALVGVEERARAAC